MEQDKITPVILAGGSGSRLWPVSTPNRPKQFQKIDGSQSLFQQTVLRVSDRDLFGAPIVVANDSYRACIHDELDEIDVKAAGLLLEPVGRNTAAAIALASLYASRNGLGRTLLVLPSDHIIQDEDALKAAVLTARDAAASGSLVTFGIAARSPETGYGYIKMGAPLPGTGVCKIERFVEKPDPSRAREFVEDGGYLWNSGMFCFSARTMLEQLERHCPALRSGVCEALQNASSEGVICRPDKTHFAVLDDISIDYAVMEKTDRAAVLPVDPCWSDVGSWASVWELGDKDDDGNVQVGDIYAIDTADSYVRSEGAHTVTIGIHNLVVVVCDGAVLIADKSRTQDVKTAVEQLKSSEERAKALRAIPRMNGMSHPVPTLQ